MYIGYAKPVTKLLNKVFTPHKIIIPKSALKDFKWTNPCFDMSINTNNILQIKANVLNPQIEFLKYMSFDYRHRMVRTRDMLQKTPVYSMNSPDIILYDGEHDKNHEDYSFTDNPQHKYLYANIDKIPLRWSYMIQDFTNLPIQVIPKNEPNKYINDDEIIDLYEKIPHQIMEAIIDNICYHKQQAKLTVNSAPIAPIEYEEEAIINEAKRYPFGVHGLNNGEWYTGNLCASPGTQYVLDKTNELKSTGYYNTVAACEGGLEIFSYYYKILDEFPGSILLNLGMFTADARYGPIYRTHCPHGKYLDFEELAVMYLAFQKFRCECNFTIIQ